MNKFTNYSPDKYVPINDGVKKNRTSKNVAPTPFVPNNSGLSHAEFCIPQEPDIMGNTPQGGCEAVGGGPGWRYTGGPEGGCCIDAFNGPTNFEPPEDLEPLEEDLEPLEEDIMEPLEEDIMEPLEEDIMEPLEDVIESFGKITLWKNNTTGTSDTTGTSNTTGQSKLKRGLIIGGIAVGTVLIIWIIYKIYMKFSERRIFPL